LKSFPQEFDALRAVAAALVDPAGVLLEANAGMRHLVADSALVAGGADPVGAKVSAFFIQPALAGLLAHPVGDNPVHQGLMTVGNRQGATRTLRGRAWRVPEGLRVLAEHDIEELERVHRSSLDMSRAAVESQFKVGRDNLRLRQSEARGIEASLTDPLTGIGNRRLLDQSLADELSRAQRAGTPLSAFMADLDFFKRVNDQHGHAAGDAVLVRFAELMRAQVRPTDVLARFGGEEFVLLMPHTALPDGVLTAERIRTNLANEVIPPLEQPVTASFGIAQLQDGEDAAALLERCDRALYAAKKGGRNRVVCLSASTGTAPADPA
jgi:diguanylate cyclase (GGDEF)-like protein